MIMILIVPLNFSCEYIETQAQLSTILGLHDTDSTISVTSIACFAANPDTQAAYEQFCYDLDHVGVTQDTIHQKETEILETLRSQGMVTSDQVDDGNVEDQGQ